MSDSVSKFYEKNRVEEFKWKYANRETNKVTYYTEDYVNELKAEIEKLKKENGNLKIDLAIAEQGGFQDLGR